MQIWRLSPFVICAILCFRGFFPYPIFFPHISQNKGQLIFEDKWPVMEPVVLKLLLQDHVDNS